MIVPLFTSLSIPFMAPTSLFRSSGYTPWHFGVPRPLTSPVRTPMLQQVSIQPLFSGSNGVVVPPVISSGSSAAAKSAPTSGTKLDVTR